MRQHALDNHVLDLVVVCTLSLLRMSLLCAALSLLWLCMATLMPRWMDDQTATFRLYPKTGQRAAEIHGTAIEDIFLDPQACGSG